MSGMIDPTTAILTRALDGLTAQQSVISSNLANIDTPGYTPQMVDFETALRREVDAWSAGPGNAPASSAAPSADIAMKTSDPRHYSALGTVGNGSSADVTAVNENTRNDGNRVDLETEMTALTETQIKYSAMSRLITGKFAQISTVLGGS